MHVDSTTVGEAKPSTSRQGFVAGERALTDEGRACLVGDGSAVGCRTNSLGGVACEDRVGDRQDSPIIEDRATLGAPGRSEVVREATGFDQR